MQIINVTFLLLFVLIYVDALLCTEYEEGEELRTLPCFHSYHKSCIDEWLARQKTCPVCKNPICA